MQSVKSLIRYDLEQGERRLRVSRTSPPSLSAAGAGQTILIGTYRHVVLGVACRVSGGRLIVRHAVAKANVVQVDVARSYLQCAVKTAQRRPAQLHRQRRSVCNAVNLLEYLRTSHCPPHASLELSELYTALTTPSLQKNTFRLCATPLNIDIIICI